MRKTAAEGMKGYHHATKHNIQDQSRFRDLELSRIDVRPVFFINTKVWMLLQRNLTKEAIFLTASN
jgi:hypothetical protein